MRILIKPFLPLNKNPILYKGKKFHLVYFGLFMAFSIFFSAALLLFYLNCKGIFFSHSVFIIFNIWLFVTLFFTKFFHIFVVGKDFFKRPLYHLNQTAMYNQGGLIGAAIGIMIIYFMERINPILLLDAVVYGSTFGLFIGRLACYNYGCCYGNPTKSKLHVIYKNPNSRVLRVHPELYNVPLHPTQLIAALFNLFLFIIFSLNVRFFSIDGIIAIIFLIAYNLFRFITQKKRGSSTNTVFSKTAIFLLSFGVLVFILSIIFREKFYTDTQFVKPMTILNFVSDIILNIKYIATLIYMAAISFFFYGLHGKKLGQYFGGEPKREIILDQLNA